MNERQYRDAIERTMNDKLTEKEKLSMLCMGLSGEVGEVVDTLKKVVFHGHELDREELIKEFGDVEWYLQHLKKHFNIEDDEVRSKNITKLMSRYKNGFSEEDSINREL